MSWCAKLASCYSVYKENQMKRHHLNNQINKYHLNISQFYSLKRRLNEDEDEKEKYDTYDSESTFNKLAILLNHSVDPSARSLPISTIILFGVKDKVSINDLECK